MIQDPNSKFQDPNPKPLIIPFLPSFSLFKNLTPVPSPEKERGDYTPEILC